ncbi:MAG: hypothetical protein KDC10_09405 [Calditrichaeota bacterium]|nr:hypothetical protein [Candidatus Cloacimonadota bacterium]MCB1047404.1 hypothetical protein [Calditrichota bacterium]MCB9472610.1 hypothetical protein [Candidatus Delongbacteria bacterium]
MKRVAGSSPFQRAVALLAIAVVATTLVGCSDDDTHAEEEHLDATGSALVFEGDTLVKATSGNASDVSGLVTLAMGDTLGPCQVLFLSDEGAWFIPEEEEGEAHAEHEHGLEIRSTGGFSGFGDAETWQVWFVPSAVGTGSFRLAVLHEGHDDYVSPLLPVQVVAAP